jgi:hypothetical protein
MEVIWGNALFTGGFAFVIGRWIVAESKTIQKKIDEVFWRMEKLEEKINDIKYTEVRKVMAEAERELKDED